MRKKPDGRVGSLAGASDREIPGWQDRAVEAVAARQKKTHRWSDRRNGTLLTYDDPFKVLLNEAARRRNISLAGYCRRAVAALIALDLGIPITAVLEHSARPGRYAAGGDGAPKGRTHDTGEGHGNWEVDFRQPTDG